MSREIKIGLTLLTTVVAAYLFVAWAKSLHFFAVRRHHYQIHFENVNGLKEGDPVTVRGLSAGNVSGIRYEMNSVLTQITLDQNIHLYEDGYAEIQMKELMGGKMIVIEPGKTGKEIENGGTLRGGISLDFSSAFSKFGKALDMFDFNMMDSLARKINQVTTNFAELSGNLEIGKFNDFFVKTSETLDRLNHVLSDLQGAKFIVKLDSTLESVHRLSAKAENMMTAADKMIRKVEEKTLPSTDSLLQKLNHTFGETEGLISDMKKVMHALSSDQTFAGKMLNDPAFAKNFQTTLDNLNEMLRIVNEDKLRIGVRLGKVKGK